jgi:phosphatidylinositol alpha-1,6-mannosyltransferase
MEDLSQLNTLTIGKVSSPDILVISRTFPPQAGGIEEYVYNRCLQDPDRVIVLTAGCSGDAAFDREQPFLVYRWLVLRFLHSSLPSRVLKQIFNMVWSFVFGIMLFLRYRYRYIEWCHGYDFPALLLLSYVLPVRFFLYLHGHDVLCPLQNPVLRSLFERTLNRTQAIVCNSSFTQDYLKAHFQFDTSTHVINPVVRPEKFGDQRVLDQAHKLRANVRATYNISEEAVVILSVGRLVRHKGHNRVIENLPVLLAEGLDVYYLICGRGPMEPELRSLASELGVEKRVLFAGYVPDEQLASYYAACDLFSMLTFFDAKNRSVEGFGIVYLEAGYFGKPVIASRVGGVEDAVRHGESGILVDPNSADEVAKALSQLCTDRQLRERLGCKGQELAKRKTLHRTLYQDSDSV